MTVLSPGTTAFGRFHVERVVGAGATGTSYLAQGPDGPVCLKVLHAASIIDRSRIKRELTRQTTVTHANVARLFEVGDAEAHAFLVREWVEGESLAAVLEREGRLPLERAAKILKDVAEGLGELHKKGFVHREVKPGHVLIDASGAKVIDCAWPSADPDYTPPEADGAKLLTLRADLWGLGVLAVHVLSGGPPSKGGALPPGVPATVASLVEQMLSADPNKRPFGTRQVSKAFEPIAEGRAVAAPAAPKKSVFATSTSRGGATAPAPKPPTPKPPPPPAAAALTEDALSLQPRVASATADDDIVDPSGLIALPDSSMAPLPRPDTDIDELSGIIQLPDESGAMPIPQPPGAARARTATLLGVSSDALGVEAEARRVKAEKVLGLGGALAAPPPPPEPAFGAPPPAPSATDTSPYDLAGEIAEHSHSVPEGMVVAEERASAPAVPVQPFMPPPVVEPASSTEPTGIDDEAEIEISHGSPPPPIASASDPDVVPFERAGIGARFAALPPRMRIGIVAGGVGLLLLVVVIALAGGGGGGEEVSAAHVPSAESEGAHPTKADRAPEKAPSKAAPASAAPASAAPGTAAPETAEPATAAAETAAPASAEPESAAPEEAAKLSKRQQQALRRRQAAAALRLGDRHLAGRRFGPATNAYTNAINLGQGAAGYYGLGRVATAQSNPRRAAGHFEKAVRMRPRSASYHLALGNAYSASGNRTKATAEWRRVLELDPNNRAAMQSLGIRPGSTSSKTKKRR